MGCPGDKTVDLCAECVNSTIIFEAADRKPHLPTHRMIKTRRPIYDKEFGTIEDLAKGVFEFVPAIYEDGVERPMTCVHCETAVSLPCWYCLDCPSSECTPNRRRNVANPDPPCTTGEYYMCESCEQRDFAFDEKHTKWHIILKISENVKEKKRSAEDRLQSLEEELAKMSQTLARILGKLGENEKGVE